MAVTIIPLTNNSVSSKIVSLTVGSFPWTTKFNFSTPATPTGAIEVNPYNIAFKIIFYSIYIHLSLLVISI